MRNQKFLIPVINEGQEIKVSTKKLTNFDTQTIISKIKVHIFEVVETNYYRFVGAGAGMEVLRRIP